MVDRYRRTVMAMVIEMAKDDPELILEFIRTLEDAGEIEPRDLEHIEKIARKWVAINQQNLMKARR